MKSLTESAVRRRARTAGYVVKKCRSRNPNNPAHDTYQLVDDRNIIVLADHTGYGETLESIAAFLEREAA